MAKGSVYEGKTHDEAVRKGLEELGLQRAEATITTIEEGKNGFLGFGARPYRVSVSRRPGGAIREPEETRSSGGSRGGRGGREERSGGRGGRGGREERSAGGRPEKPADKGEKSDRPDRGGRGERGGRGAREERKVGERRPEPVRAEGAVVEERPERPERAERPDRGERRGRGGREAREPREARENREPREERRSAPPAAAASPAPMQAANVPAADSDEDGAAGDRRRRRRGRRGGRGRRREGRAEGSVAGRETQDMGEVRESVPSHVNGAVTPERIEAPVATFQHEAAPAPMVTPAAAPVPAYSAPAPVAPVAEPESVVTMAAHVSSPAAASVGAAPAPAQRAPRPTRHTEEPDMGSDELTATAQRVTEELLKAMGFDATVTATADNDRVDVTIQVASGEDLLNGHKGETRQALQHLLNRFVNRGEGSRYHLQLEVNDFWQQREKELEDLALALADAALAENAEKVTELMNSQERRIVHVTLKPDARVKSYSLGEGMLKRVAIAPADFAERSEDHGG